MKHFIHLPSLQKSLGKKWNECEIPSSGSNKTYLHNLKKKKKAHRGISSIQTVTLWDLSCLNFLLGLCCTGNTVTTQAGSLSGALFTSLVKLESLCH